MKPARAVIVLFACIAVLPCFAQQQVASPQAREQFFHLCEIACNDLDSPLRSVPFYIDSYAVRPLAVAYDMTGKQRYLDACRKWSDRMISYQEKMIPSGAYYMNYGRKPGQSEAGWYVADSSSIAMGILSTAVRCNQSAERERYLKSVRSFAQLVLDNYVGSSGGIRNGHWSKFDGEWWCSSGIFGSLCFLLYNETGNAAYLNTGLGVIDWLNHQDFETTTPYSLNEMGPTLPMYFFEAYSAGLPKWKSNPNLQPAAAKQIQKLLSWVDQNVPKDGDSERWSYSTQWGSKFGGLPFHLQVYAAALPGTTPARTAAEHELARLPLLLKNAPPRPPLSQLATFTMMSYAEKVSPGTLYRKSSPTRFPSPRKEK